VFSAPNYCGYYDNKASILLLEDEGAITLKQYDQTEPPYRLPDNMDIFSWSLPFLVDKVANMFYTLMMKLGELDEVEQVCDA